MAASLSRTMEDLNGKWAVNKKLSDNPNETLALQGIPHLARSAIQMAHVTYDLVQYTKSFEGKGGGRREVAFLEVTHTASGLLRGSKDVSCVEDSPRETTDWLFGTVVVQTRWATLEEMGDPFLREGWLDEVEGKAVRVTCAKNKLRRAQESGWRVEYGPGKALR
ncbi:hypothetical protein VTK73DRAFT_4045 [Phialemonium thermophilum]|uniref:Lipocalin-like domain-containing protein n=1 Tax=Phialemonium thermophilum TaxID=223376 RepID=A0ABR3WVF5_9PEZI